MTKIIESRRRFKSRLDAKQDVSRSIPALMGDGNGTIEVPNQPGYVYIRIGDGDLGQAFNNRCPLADNLAIEVGYDPVTDPDRRIFQVLSVRMNDYAGSGSTPYANVPSHHATHEFGGGDDVFLSWRRLMGLRVGRPSGFSVTIDEGFILRAGAWLAVLAQTLDLTASKPALATQARYVLIALNAAGVATATNGALVAVGALDISDCPIPAAGEIPLAAVRMYGTQTSIGDTPSAPDIIDLRFPQAASTGSVYLADLQKGTAQYQVITSGANPYPATWSDFFVRGTAGGTTFFFVVNTKTLTFSAADNFTLAAGRTGEIIVWNQASNNIIGYEGGNARGAGAVDWQLIRTFDTQVASGDYTAIIGGRYNTVTGQDSTAGGYYTSVTHTGCFLWADPTVAGFASIVNNEFAIQASGGFRVAYNNTNYAQVTVSAAGVTTFNATGASAGFTFSDVVTLPAAGLVVTGMARGDLLTGNATPAFARLAKGAAYAVLTGDGTDTAWSAYLLSGTAGGKTTFAVTNTKTLTLTATDDYNLTIPATGTAALLGVANPFTLTNTFASQIGIGTTDIEAWNASYRAIEGYRSAIMFGAASDYMAIMSNAYYDGTWKYKATAASALYTASAGAHIFRTAASGTIDNAITWITALSIGITGGVNVGGVVDPGDNNLLVDGEVRVAGDAGGVASTNTLTGVSNLAANSTGVGTIKFKGATNRDSTGFIKIYIGTTAYYVPVFSAITG